MTRKKSIIGRLLKYIKVNEVTGCWEWQGSCNTTGLHYARLRINGVGVLCHRLTFKLFSGNIPGNMLVLHHCDNPPCINPKHLFLGSYSDNIKDALDKNRMARGEKNGRSKLTDNKVLSIRKKHSTGEYTLEGLAIEYSVDQHTIFDVIKRRTWNHVEQEVL